MGLRYQTAEHLRPYPHETCHVGNFKSYTDLSSAAKWTVKSKQNWLKIANVLNDLNAKWFTIGEVNLMETRDVRQCHAESYITTLATIMPLKPSQLVLPQL